MADEAYIQSTLVIDKKSSDGVVEIAHTKARTFRVDVDGTKGPTPGAFTASPGGVILDLSQLTIPGLATIESNDDDEGNYIELCIYDPQTDKTYPFLEIGAGEQYVIKLSRNLFEEYASTGTGTTGPTNQLLVRSFNAAANGSLQAFEK